MVQLPPAMVVWPATGKRCVPLVGHVAAHEAPKKVKIRVLVPAATVD